MADNYSRRPYSRSDQQQSYRSSETARGGHNETSRRGSDPLAELARLIGEKDPFAEYGREISHQPSSPSRGSEQPPQYLMRQRGNRANPPGAYGDGRGNSNGESYGAEDQNVYEDYELPRKRRGGLVIAGVLGLAVLGTATAFAYRSFFNADDANRQPRVIKANSAPAKIVPDNAAGNKKRNDERAQRRAPETIVSREEQPMDRPTAMKEELVTSAKDEGGLSNNPAAPGPGSGVVVAEPKKIRTIPILPDGSMAVSAVRNEAISPPTSRELASSAQSGPAAAEPDAISSQSKRTGTTRTVAASPPRATLPTSANAPLSLTPTAPTRVASAGPASSIPATAAPNAPTSGYGVQVTSQRSEAEAQSALRNLQVKHPDKLGGKPFFIHKADLGSKGVYYRAVVGPLATAGAANELCESLKAAGGQCIIRKN